MFALYRFKMKRKITTVVKVNMKEEDNKNRN